MLPAAVRPRQHRAQCPAQKWGHGVAAHPGAEQADAIQRVGNLVSTLEKVERPRDLTSPVDAPWVRRIRDTWHRVDGSTSGETLAAALDVGVADVSVKITSTDGLGSIGRGEGIACWAACLLAQR